MVLVVIFFRIFETKLFALSLLYVTCKQHLNSSDARETAICSFTGITHISEKISRCCLHLREVNYSLNIVDRVISSNNKAKKIISKI